MDNEMLFYLDEVSIRSICKDLLRNWWVILLAAVTVVLGVSAYNSVIHTSEYTASATLVVSAKGSGSSGNAYASLTTTTEMASVFQDVFQSNVLIKKIQEDIGKDNLDVSITAAVIPETNLVTVQVTAKNPKEAYMVIKSALRCYPQASEYLFSNAVLEVLQSPTVPRTPSNVLQVSKYEKLGALAGAALLAALIVLCSILRSTVKTEQAAKRRLLGKQLALIGHEEKNRTIKTKIGKANKAILITNPVTSFGYVESFRKLAFKIQRQMEPSGNKVLLVSSVSENEGKSTVASNIALALAQKGKKVVLVDMDLRNPAIYKLFDQGKGCSNLQKLLNGESEIQFETKSSLFLVLNENAVKNPIRMLHSPKLAAFIKEAAEAADYVIIDSAPISAAADTEVISGFADASLLVIRQDWAYVENINEAIDVMDKGDTEFLGYILNDFESKSPIGNGQYDYGYGKKYGYYGYGEYRKINQ